MNEKRFPSPLGMAGSGTVVAVGADVKTLRVGDDVYGHNVRKPMFLDPPTFFASEYARVRAANLLVKPAHVPFESAAALSGLVVTACQTIRRGLRLAGWSSLEGRTVYVPAALSGTGCVIIQVARNVFGAGRIVSTASTAKMDLVERHLPGMVDQLIDYQKTRNLLDVVPRGSVDFAINTQLATLAPAVPLMNPRTGVLMSVTSVPTRATVLEMLGPERMPFWLGPALDLAQWYYRWLLWGTSVRHEMVSGNPAVREDLEEAGEIIARGLVKGVVRVVPLEDIEGVRKGCNEVYTQVGGVGRMIVKVRKD